jgi:high-affinity iron transporter
MKPLELSHTFPQRTGYTKRAPWFVIAVTTIVAAVAVLVWQGILSPGNPDPLASQTSRLAAVFDIAVLVLREGLECILVLAAITAGLIGDHQKYRQQVAAGAGIGLVATVVTWCVAVRILDDISGKVSALQLQAATGLLAVVVLLIVMNWFFHKMYWTGWISLHNRKKRELLEKSQIQATSTKLIFGMALLGFSSFYREGVEVVLFLQSYRLRLGNEPVYLGVLLGSALAGAVAVLTFIAQQKLPYRKMLVFTGVLLGLVLLVMAGEQAQEMQLAHWLPSTSVSWLAGRIPGWMSLWFSIYPSVETIAAQAFALIAVLGSYLVAERSRANAL